MKTQFDMEMTNIRRELLDLKSWSQKKAQQLRTTSITIPVQFTLSKNIYHDVRASQSALITITPFPGTKPILSLTVDTTDLEGRTFYFEGTVQDDGSYVFEFFLNGTFNPNDTIGTVLNYNLVATSTSTIDYELVYQDED